MSITAFTDIVGELNYEGRVTGQWQRRTFNNVLTFWFADNNRLKLEQSYPTQGFVVLHQQIIETIGAWPAATERSDIGMSMKASKIVTRTEGAMIFAGLAEVQPIMAARVDADGEEVLETALLSNLIGQIPASINDAGFKQ
jgi:hypothetical protein